MTAAPMGSMVERHKWAVVLAGGEDARLRALTRLVAGDERPKQFCRLLGQQTLLGATRQRVGLTVNPRRTVYVVSRHHLRFYRSELDGVPVTRLIEQPVARGTTAGWTDLGQPARVLEALSARRRFQPIAGLVAS